MLSFEAARAHILSDVERLSVERLPLGLAAGRVLAEDLVARTPLPPFDHSAMDGYAVATADLDGEGPFRLAVVGESRAGFGSSALPAGAACRILTGAPMPRRADAVVMQENAAREGSAVRFDARPLAFQHVRRAGEDMARGALAIAEGTRLSPGGLALAAMLDRFEVVVARRPLVTILCTGDELRAAGALASAASIPESNSAPLAALARQAGARVRVAPIACDDLESTLRAVQQALDGTDVLLTVGGVSVGDHDVVRPALERAGAVLDFWKVAVKPGKPLALGRRGAARILCLPGNPASAIVTFAMFGMPLLRAMQGDRHPIGRPLRVRLGAARKRSPDRLELVRAVLGADGDGMTVTAHDNQSSGAATSLAHSDGLVLISPGEGLIDAGTAVDFVRWSDG